MRGFSSLPLPALRLGARCAEGYGAFVSAPLFVFVQMDFPWQIGPADGRYLLRAACGWRPRARARAADLKQDAASSSRIMLDRVAAGRAPGARLAR